MKLNKYKMKIGIPESVEFLVYGKDNFEIPKDLEGAYYNIRKHGSALSKKQQELVIEKYSEIINGI